MPRCRCPHCGRVQVIERSVVGDYVGCLGARCERTFVAEPHDGRPASVAGFLALVAAAGLVYLLIVTVAQPWRWSWLLSKF